MRVTQSMISGNMLRNLSNSYSQLNKYMNQLNTGKKINRPSDDPLVALQGMGYRAELDQIQQYQRNTGEVQNWFDNTDAALDKATSALQRVRELAIQASNGTNDENELESIRMEVEQLKQHLVDIANTNVNDKYIFNGTNTTEAPYNTDGSQSEGYNSNPVLIGVAGETSLKANVNGEDVFGGEPGIFAAIDTFINKLGSGAEEDMSESISQLDEGINKVINARADLGARMNRLELINNRLDEQEVVATKTMSENEDIDYSEVITKLITQESIHRAALATGSRIIQPTLIDFLR